MSSDVWALSLVAVWAVVAAFSALPLTRRWRESRSLTAHRKALTTLETVVRHGPPAEPAPHSEVQPEVHPSAGPSAGPVPAASAGPAPHPRVPHAAGASTAGAPSSAAPAQPAAPLPPRPPAPRATAPGGAERGRRTLPRSFRATRPPDTVAIDDAAQRPIRPKASAATPARATSLAPAEVVRELIPELTRRVKEQRRPPGDRKKPLFPGHRGPRLAGWRPTRRRPADRRPPRSPRQGRQRPGARTRRSLRRLLVSGALTAALAGAVAVAVVASSSGGGGPPPTSHHAAAPRTSVRSRPSSKTPATVPPGVPAVQVLSSGPAGVNLVVPSGSHVRFSAIGPCWLEVTPTGEPPVFEGILQAGDVKSFPVRGSLWTRVGAASEVQVTLDGEPVALPAIGPNPLDITFATGTASGASPGSGT